MLSLLIENRNQKTNLDIIRGEGKMPAVFYGPKEASTPISVNAIEFQKTWKKAGESSVIILKDAKGVELEALIYAVDKHPITGVPRHADFYIVEKGKKVRVAVPIVFEGVSPAVKDKGGILVKVLREIEVEAAPRDLPRDIKVNISSLVEFTDVVKAKDLVLPSGVELKINLEDVVASISEAKEEVEVAPAAIDMSAIEVEAKGKEVKEGDAAAPAGDAKADDKKSGDKKSPDKK